MRPTVAQAIIGLLLSTTLAGALALPGQVVIAEDPPPTGLALPAPAPQHEDVVRAAPVAPPAAQRSPTASEPERAPVARVPQGGVAGAHHARNQSEPAPAPPPALIEKPAAPPPPQATPPPVAPPPPPAEPAPPPAAEPVEASPPKTKKAKKAKKPKKEKKEKKEKSEPQTTGNAQGDDEDDDARGKDKDKPKDKGKDDQGQAGHDAGHGNRGDENHGRR